MANKGRYMKRFAGGVAVLALVCFGVATNAMALVWTGTDTAPGGGFDYSRNTVAYFDPNGLGTTITGTLDLSQLTLGSTVMFGLIDKQNFDGGISSGFMGGAYAYFSRFSDTVLRIGPTDGNANPQGAIVSGTSGTFRAATYQSEIDFILNIHNGVIDLSSPSGDFETQSWTYGLIKKLNNSNPYAWNEFEFGAYLGYEFVPGNSAATFGFNVNATPEVSVPEPGTLLLLGSGLLGLALTGARKKFRK